MNPKVIISHRKERRDGLKVAERVRAGRTGHGGRIWQYPSSSAECFESDEGCAHRCDRVLWKDFSGDHLEALSYTRSENLESDHRPVLCVFRLTPKVAEQQAHASAHANGSSLVSITSTVAGRTPLPPPKAPVTQESGQLGKILPPESQKKPQSSCPGRPPPPPPGHPPPTRDKSDPPAKNDNDPFDFPFFSSRNLPAKGCLTPSNSLFEDFHDDLLAPIHAPPNQRPMSPSDPFTSLADSFKTDKIALHQMSGPGNTAPSQQDWITFGNSVEEERAGGSAFGESSSSFGIDTPASCDNGGAVSDGGTFSSYGSSRLACLGESDVSFGNGGDISACGFAGYANLSVSAQAASFVSNGGNDYREGRHFDPFADLVAHDASVSSSTTKVPSGKGMPPPEHLPAHGISMNPFGDDDEDEDDSHGWVCRSFTFGALPLLSNLYSCFEGYIHSGA